MPYSSAHLPPSFLQCPPPSLMTSQTWLSPGCHPQSSPATPRACPPPRCPGARRGLSWAAEEGATASCPEVQPGAAQPGRGQGVLPALPPPPLCLLFSRSAGDPAGAACTQRPLHLHGSERRGHGPEAPVAHSAWYARLQGPAAAGPAPSSQGSTFLPFTEPPALKPLPGMVMVMVNTSTVLSCEATGVPRPEVTWQKDGVGITGGEQECSGGWQSPRCLPAFPWGEI